MLARGKTIWAHERNRLKTARNAQRLILRDIDKKTAALVRMRDALIAERDTPVCASRQILVATTDPVEKRASRRSAADAADAAAVRPAPVPVRTLSRRNMPAAALRPTWLKPAINLAAASRRPQPVVSVAIRPPGKRRSPKQLLPARAFGGAVQARSLTASATPSRAAPLLPTSPSMPIEQVAFVATDPRTRHEPPAPLVIAQASPRSAPPIIVETMHEVVRRLCTYRRKKEIDPAIRALHRRRALVEEGDRWPARQLLTERLWLELNPRTAYTRTARDRVLTRDRDRLELIASGGGYVRASVRTACWSKPSLTFASRRRTGHGGRKCMFRLSSPTCGRGSRR